MFNSKNITSIIIKNSIISVVIILVSFFIIYNIKNEINKITDKVSLNNKINNEFKIRTELFSVIKENAGQIGQNDLIIEKAFIPSNDISLFIDTLDKLVSESKIPQSYRFDTPIPSTQIEDISFSNISYSNNLNINVNDFIKYLKEYENLPYFTKIESINISSQDKEGIYEQSTVSIKGVLLTKDTK